MKALLKAAPRPGAELVEVEVPEAGPGEVVCKVIRASICGTDYHIYTWDDWAASRIEVPRIFGHEFCGEVVKVGPGVQQVSLGDYVTAETHIVCGHCAQCRQGQAHVCQEVAVIGVDVDGCFAEYVKVPAQNLWHTDRALPPEVAAIQEPLGNAVHTVFAGDITGKTVAVIGCGPIGLFSIAICRIAGARTIFATDVNPYRLELARDLGADEVLNAAEIDVAAEILAETKGQGVDVMLEMSGNPDAIRAGFRVLRSGGRASLLGIPSRPVEIDLTNEIIFKGAVVQGIFGRRMYETWHLTSSLLASGLDVSPVITHVLPMDRYAEAMELMGSGNCGKVILKP